MARRKRNSRTDNPFDDDQVTQRQTRTAPRPRRWPYVLLLLVLLVGLLPNILGWTGLHQTAINYAAQDFKGKITVEKASFGWFQPVTLTNIVAVDEQGNQLLTVAQFKSSKPLYSFATSNDYGQFDVQQPTIYLQLRPDGSNIEDALANFISTQTTGQSPNPDQNVNQEPTTAPTLLPKMTLNVTDGRAMVTSSTDPQAWQIDQFKAIVQTSTDSAPLTIESECQILPLIIGVDGQPISQSPGSLAINSQFDPGETTLSLGNAEIVLVTNNFPVSIAAPLMQRFVGPAQSAGQLSGKIYSKINLNQSAMNVELTQLNLSQLVFAAPELIGSDQFSLQSLTANGSMNISPKTISSSNFQIDSDVGRINANGTFEVNQLNDIATGGALLDSPFQMDGQIDLAGLVRMLPATLKLHEDLSVDSGTIQFNAGTRNEEGVRRLVMNLEAANLKARRGAQNIVWQKPLRLVGTIIQSNNHLAVEDLLCESDFLTIAGSATVKTGAFRTRGDLSKLIARVGEFVDLAGTDLAGEIDGTFGWQTAENETQNPTTGQPIQIGGNFVINNPVIQLPDMPVWRQPKMSLKLSASGQTITNPQTSEMILQLATGGAQIEVGAETAIATLAAPLNNALTDPVRLNCQMNGSLGGWLRHIQNFVDLGDVTAAGQLALTCQAALDNSLVQLSGIQFTIEQLAFDGYGVKIRDPNMTGTAEVIYDLNSGKIAIADTTLSGTTLAARGQNLTIAYAGESAENMLVDGAIAFRGDVNRVADWFELSPTDDSIFWFGSIEGNLQLASSESGIGGQLTSTITDLVAAQRNTKDRSTGTPTNNAVQPVSNSAPWTELFRESTTQLDSELLLANDFNAIQFRNLVMKSSALNVKATGTIADLADSMLTNIQGTWNPDWTKVKVLLSAYTGDLFQLSGSGEQPFSVNGPIFSASTDPQAASAWIPAQLAATTSLRWDSGSVMNVPIGASELNVDIQNSIGNIKTPGIPFSGGVVQFAPRVDMRGENPVLRMDRTRIIDNVALTPETTRQWLKYVAPLAADATSAQGNFTVDTESVSVPLFDPMSAEVAGAVQLSNVVIGAGPLADQLLGTITQIRSILKPNASERDYKTWLKMSEQTIPVQVKDQRVYHENVTFSHNDTTVRTRGSVGFDQTLNMLAEIPIADDWIAGSPYLAGLKGQSFSIPISGTVSKPVFDKRSIEQFSTQLVKQAASGALNQAIADKVSPELEKIQSQVNEKLGGEINKLQGQFGEKLGGFLPAGTTSGNQPATGGTTPDVGKKLEGELMKGLGNLFGGKK